MLQGSRLRGRMPGGARFYWGLASGTYYLVE